MDVTQWAETVTLAVSKYARRASKDQKDDLVQECYLKLLEEQDAIEAADDPPQFVFTTCRNKIIDIFRSNESLIQQTALEDASALGSPVISNSFGVSPDDLERAIQRLPEPQAYIIWCSYYQGLTEDELAKLLGKSRRTVQRSKEAALAALKEILEG